MSLKPFAFHFGETLTEAPPGHAASVTLPTILYRTDIAVSKSHIPTQLYLARVTRTLDQSNACLRIEGGPNDTVTVGAVARCTQNFEPATPHR